MGIFLVYILKASVCMAIFYLFYRLLLSRETFHRFNRVALLSLLLLSLLLPLVQVTMAEQTEVHRTVLTVEQLLLMASQSSGVADVQAVAATVSWIQVLLLIYLAGIAFFTFRHLYLLAQLVTLVRSGRREKIEHGVRLIVHQKEIAPFSWMRYIVISEKDLKENGREILIHEMAHIRNRHSIDLLVADVCIFFQWFNPAIWLLKQELQNIHEYEADETVIKKGVDAKQYQLLLIKKAVGTRLYSMANSFNHSKLKKRITMMLKEKSSPWARLKYLYVLPLAAIAVTAFARPEVSDKVKEISAVKVNDLTAIVETKVQETVERQKRTTYTPVDYSTLITSSKNPKTGDLNHRISVDLKILDEKGKPVEKGTVIVIPFSTNTGAISGPGGEVKLTGVPEGNVLRIFYGGAANSGIFVAAMPKLTLALHSNKKPGKVVEKQAKIVRDTVAAKAQKTVPKVVNDTKKAIRMEDVKVIGYKTITNSLETVPEKSWDGNLVDGVNFHRLSSSKNTGQPLIIIDEKEADSSLLKAISPDRIESISVLKDATAVKVYGDKGKNGVILITLLTEEEFQQNKK